MGLRPSVSGLCISSARAGGVALCSGFAGNENAPEERDLAANRSVLDGGGEVHHAVTGGGAAAAFSGGRVSIANSILWDPSQSAGSCELYESADSVVGVDHVVAADLCADGDASAIDDPLFADPENGDFHLTLASPCVDAADDAQAPALDFAGNGRVDVDGVGSSIADLGALELVDGQ